MGDVPLTLGGRGVWARKTIISPVTSAQGPNRVLSTLACIAHRHFRVAHEAAISSLLPGPRAGQALYYRSIQK